MQGRIRDRNKERHRESEKSKHKSRNMKKKGSNRRIRLRNKEEIERGEQSTRERAKEVGTRGNTSRETRSDNEQQIDG